MKKFLNFILKLFISLFILYFIFLEVDFRSVFEAIKRVNLFDFLVALIIIFVCWVINSKKWQLLLEFLGFKEKLFSLFRLNLISLFYTVILPGGQLTGETIKCYKITRGSEEKGKLILSVFMDRLTGFWAIVFLGLAGILFTRSTIGSYEDILSLYLILAVGCLIAMIFFNRRIGSFLERICLILESKIRNEKIRLFFQKILSLFLAFKGAYKILSISLVYGLVYQLLNSLCIYFLFLSLNLKLTFFDLLWINTLASVVTLIPITILGLGLREGSFLFLLGLIGFTSAQSLSLSLLISTIYLMNGLAGGAIEFYEIFINKNHLRFKR